MDFLAPLLEEGVQFLVFQVVRSHRLNLAVIFLEREFANLARIVQAEQVVNVKKKGKLDVKG